MTQYYKDTYTPNYGDGLALCGIKVFGHLPATISEADVSDTTGDIQTNWKCFCGSDEDLKAPIKTNSDSSESAYVRYRYLYPFLYDTEAS